MDPAWLPVCPAPVWLPVLPLPPVLELPVVPAELPAPAALPLPDVLPLALPGLLVLALPIFAFFNTNSPPAPALPAAPVELEDELARARQPVTVISRCDCELLRSSSRVVGCDWLLPVEPVWPAWPDAPDDCADTTPQVVARAKLPATISLCQWKVFFMPDLLV